MRIEKLWIFGTKFVMHTAEVIGYALREFTHVKLQLLHYEIIYKLMAIIIIVNSYNLHKYIQKNNTFIITIIIISLSRYEYKLEETLESDRY